MHKSNVKRNIVVILLVAVALFFIAGTYARYSTVGTGNAVIDVAKWNVLMKNGNTTLSSTTQNIDFVVNSNSYVVSNKMAPATSATADIDVYLEGTEVAVDLVTVIDQTALASVIGSNANISVSTTLDGVSYTSGTPITVALPENGQAFTAANGTKRLKLTINWTNDDTNNAADTAIGTASETDRHVTIPVTLTAQQHIAAN